MLTTNENASRCLTVVSKKKLKLYFCIRFEGSAIWQFLSAVIKLESVFTCVNNEQSITVQGWTTLLPRGPHLKKIWFPLAGTSTALLKVKIEFNTQQRHLTVKGF